MTGGRRWLALPGLIAANLVPLWLVARGSLETADLLLSYVLELVVLVVLWDRRTLRRSIRTYGKDLLGPLGLGVLVFGAATVRVLGEVTWDRGTLLAVLTTCVSMAIGVVLSVRESGKGVTTGAILWRLALLVTGAVVGIGTARAYGELVATGWEPTRLGHAWSFPFGQLLARAGLALDVAPLVIPALFVVLVRTVNEVLYETYDILRDADVDRQGSRDALAVMHAERQRQHQQARQRQGDADQGR